MAVNENTFYVTITVDGTDPVKCANVANQISEQCINVYPKYFDYGQIGIIRTAKEPSAPYSPDKLKNTLIGAAIGLVLACVISILLELIDTTIKPDEDLSEIYKVPVFAEIPDFES
jgi:capsular polysaccharide biosynthesis protein